MVAITVILAAVIGAFVLEIGDQQETAPSTSFDSEQQTKFYCTGGGSPTKANLTSVGISHAGGSVIDISQVQVKVEGNASTWEMDERRECGNGNDRIKPTPDFRQALGTNQKVEFTSGETWSPYIRSGLDHDRVEKAGRYEVTYVTGPDDVGSIQHFGGTNSFSTPPVPSKIESGHQMNVVWSASSGGKTQTLFRYTVQ
jgi:hypothetical protein